MRPVGWILAFAVFLLTLAVGELIVGGHDAGLAGASLDVAASSTLLLASGVLLLFAAYQLIELSRRKSWKGGARPPCKPLVLVAFLVTILLGVYLFLSALKTSTAQRAVVAAVAFVVLVVVPLVGLYVFGRDARVTLPRLGTVALGLVGTAIGAWQFWYQNQYVPSHAGPAVAIKVDLHLVAEQKAYDVIRASVNYENLSGPRVSVIGSTYTLTGSRVVRCHRPSTTANVRGVFGGFLADPQRSRYMADVWEEQPSAVLAAGKFVGDGKRLDQNVSSGRDFVFFVPRRRYQLLRFRAQLFAIPASVPLSQRTLPTFKHFGGDSELYGFWHIDDDSWLHDLLYGRERWVILRYELVDPTQKTSSQTSPDLRVTARFPNATWTEGRPSEARVKSLFAQRQAYDASEPFGDAELALEPVAKPTAHDKLPRPCRTGR